MNVKTIWLITENAEISSLRELHHNTLGVKNVILSVGLDSAYKKFAPEILDVPVVHNGFIGETKDYELIELQEPSFWDYIDNFMDRTLIIAGNRTKKIINITIDGIYVLCPGVHTVKMIWF